MKREIFCLDCVIGLVIGALVGMVSRMVSGEMALGWIFIDAVIGLVVGGGVSAMADEIAKMEEAAGKTDSERTTQDMLDGGLVGLVAGFLIGYIGLTAGYISQYGGTMLFRNGYFFGFIVVSIVVGACGFIVGAFVKAVYSRLFHNK